MSSLSIDFVADRSSGGILTLVDAGIQSGQIPNDDEHDGVRLLHRYGNEEIRVVEQESASLRTRSRRALAISIGANTGDCPHSILDG